MRNCSSNMQRGRIHWPADPLYSCEFLIADVKIRRVKWVKNGILIKLFFTDASIRNRAAAIIPCGATEVKDQEARGPNKRHSQQRERMHQPAGRQQNWKLAAALLRVSSRWRRRCRRRRCRRRHRHRHLSSHVSDSHGSLLCICGGEC